MKQDYYIENLFEIEDVEIQNILTLIAKLPYVDLVMVSPSGSAVFVECLDEFHIQQKHVKEIQSILPNSWNLDLEYDEYTDGFTMLLNC